MSNPLSEHEIESKLTDLNDWRFEQNFIRKSIRFTTFRDAVSFLVRVSFEAEQLDHHPEIFNCYNQVDISINTHDVGGKVTEKDFALASAIDACSS